MEFGRYVVLSTAHVRSATAEKLTFWAGQLPCDQALGVASTQSGWFLPTRVIALPADPRLPSELDAILAFGRDHGCDYVLLDSDGGRASARPIFPW